MTEVPKNIPLDIPGLNTRKQYGEPYRFANTTNMPEKTVKINGKGKAMTIGEAYEQWQQEELKKRKPENDPWKNLQDFFEVDDKYKEGLQQLHIKYKEYCKSCAETLNKKRFTLSNNNAERFKNLNRLARLLETPPLVCVAVGLQDGQIYFAANTKPDKLKERIATLISIIKQGTQIKESIKQRLLNHITLSDEQEKLADNILPALDETELKNALLQYHEKNVIISKLPSKFAVHAEILLLEKFSPGFKHTTPNNLLLGISKLCCTKCAALVFSLEQRKLLSSTEIITGAHDNTYSNWHLPITVPLDLAIGKDAIGIVNNYHINESDAYEIVNGSIDIVTDKAGLPEIKRDSF